MMPLLSIMVPTTPDRSDCFGLLWAELERQSRGLPVELFYDDEGKSLSIGLKRDRMYHRARGKWAVQWDSDDWIAEDGIVKIINALGNNPDAECCTYQELCVINGVTEYSNFSMIYHDWHENPQWPTGFKYARTPFFKTPILTSLCKDVGVKDWRYGEDHDFAKRIRPFLKTAVHIPEFIYHYIHNSKPEDHNERYGIRLE